MAKDESEFVDPFSAERDSESDGAGQEGQQESHEVVEEIPPTPEEADERELPLAERERRKLARMTPEQKARYDTATKELMSHPAVARFAASEAHHAEKMEHYRSEFLKEIAKKKKEKA